MRLRRAPRHAPVVDATAKEIAADARPLSRITGTGTTTMSTVTTLRTERLLEPGHAAGTNAGGSRCPPPLFTATTHVERPPRPRLTPKPGPISLPSGRRPHPKRGRNEKRPPTEAASTFQAKIAKTVAPSKTRVHASEVANHNGLCFMAYPKPRWSAA